MVGRFLNQPNLFVGGVAGIVLRLRPVLIPFDKNVPAQVLSISGPRRFTTPARGSGDFL
jgi:hypothetical protein